MRLVALLVLSALAPGCAKTREPAPDDLDGLLHYLYRYHTDADAVEEATGILGEWLESTGRTEEANEGFLLTALTEEETADIEHPARDLAMAQGVGAGTVSGFPIDAHADAILLADQTFNDPDSYAKYDREVIEGDEDAFRDGEGTIRTLNDIDKTKVGVSIPYVLHKDFAWTRIDDERRAIVARSWIADGSCSENGNNCLHQSFSVDIWYSHDDDDTVRFTATWNEITSVADAFLSEDQKVAVAVNGLMSIFEETDAFLAEQN